MNKTKFYINIYKYVIKYNNIYLYITYNYKLLDIILNNVIYILVL